MMIVYSLLKNEDENKFKIASIVENEDNSDNWYSYLLNDILSGCSYKPAEIVKNNIRIITFNYDLSLDYYLYSKLKSIERIKGAVGDDFWEDLKKNRIKHVYGQLYIHDEIDGYGNFVGTEYYSKEKADQNFKRFLMAYKGKGEILLINDERNHANNNDHFSTIKNIVNNAEEIIIIGFSFDRDNFDILGFPKEEEAWTKFLNNKNLKYMDFDGKMKSLSSQFYSLPSLAHSYVTRSESRKIADAYQNDFKIYLY